MKHIGIDLAWTYKNETGICILSDNGQIEKLDAAVFTDEQIVEIIKSYSDETLCISIDAPLIVKNEGGSRAAEGALMRHKINGHHLSVFNANRNFFIKSYGQLRGETLTRKIIEEVPNCTVSTMPLNQQHSIIEAFPSGICCGLFPEVYPVKYKLNNKTPFEHSRQEMQRILNRLIECETMEQRVIGLKPYFGNQDMVMTKAHHKHMEDMVDAFLCAYSSYCKVKGYSDWLIFGNAEDGFISIAISKGIPRKGIAQNDTSQVTSILSIAEALLNKDKSGALSILEANMPHEWTTTEERKMTVYEKLCLYIRDGFIDRYSGDKLVFPNVLRLLSHELGDAFPYHPNWKMSDCHIAYWNLTPTYDHVKPIARGGLDTADNIVTTSMLMNSRKANWTLDEIGYDVHNAGDLQEWDGMIRWYKTYIEMNGMPELEGSFALWHKALERYEREYGDIL